MRFDDILLALILRKPISGYDIKKWLDTEGVFMRANADQSQIYRTLHRLRRNGLVEQVLETRPAAPDAKVYMATPAGAQRLKDLAREPFEPRARWQEPDFLARFVMVGIFVPESVVPLIRTELEFRRAQVARVRHRERKLELVTTYFEVDQSTADELSNDSHGLGVAGADLWIAWLADELAKWGDRYPEPFGAIEAKPTTSEM